MSETAEPIRVSIREAGGRILTATTDGRRWEPFHCAAEDAYALGLYLRNLATMPGAVATLADVLVRCAEPPAAFEQPPAEHPLQPGRILRFKMAAEGGSASVLEEDVQVVLRADEADGGRRP